jgi:hypothetical protein
VFAEEPDDLSATFALLREGHNLSALLLAALLIALVVETLLANRLSPRQQGTAAGQPAPGGRGAA